MKKSVVLILSMLAIFLFHGAAFAVEAPKIGVVDMQKFQKNSKAFQKIRAQIQKKFQEMQKKLDQEKTALRKLEEEYKKQSMMLSLDAQEGKKRELEKKRRYYKYLQDDFTKELKATEVDTMNRIMNELEGIIKQIGEKGGYTLILERRALGLIYYDNAIDITDQVTEAYDKMKQ